VTIYSRRGYDWTEQFAPIAKAASELKVREAIIDGEVTVLGKTGFPDFQALRGELGNRESTRLLYHAFDLLYLNGRDLRRAPLLKRKKALKSILKKSQQRSRMSTFSKQTARACWSRRAAWALRDRGKTC
jgi:bifunctional non-homologous end joining protein LigD